MLLDHHVTDVVLEGHSDKSTFLHKFLSNKEVHRVGAQQMTGRMSVISEMNLIRGFFLSRSIPL